MGNPILHVVTVFQLAKDEKWEKTRKKEVYDASLKEQFTGGKISDGHFSHGNSQRKVTPFA